MNSCLVSTAKDRSTLFRLISDARLGARFTVNKLSHRIRDGHRRHLSGNERVPSNFTSVYDVLEFPNTFEGNWVHNFIVFNSKVNGKIILTQDDMRKFMGNPPRNVYEAISFDAKNGARTARGQGNMSSWPIRNPITRVVLLNWLMYPKKIP